MTVARMVSKRWRDLVIAFIAITVSFFAFTAVISAPLGSDNSASGFVKFYGTSTVRHMRPDRVAVLASGANGTISFWQYDNDSHWVRVNPTATYGDTNISMLDGQPYWFEFNERRRAPDAAWVNAGVGTVRMLWE